MKYVAAYLLASLGGKADPSKADIENILGKYFSSISLYILPISASVGADADAENTNAVLSALKGKNIEEVIAEGSKKLASVPSGAAPSASAPVAASAAAPAKEAERKKEEPKEESE